MLKAQAQRLEELVANLEAELEEDENPATRRRLNVAAEKLAAVNAELAPLMARRTNQLFEDFQRAVNGTLEEQLSSLRHVWRKYRHPRVADLIDCLSTELAATLPPIPAAEVPAVFARRDPAEVGRLLTMPWPTDPELERLLIQSILWLPDDPRVAAVCARELDLRRWGRGSSAVDYRPLYERLNALGDVRQLPVLERQLTRPNRTSRALDQEAVAVHRALDPELPAEFEALVVVLESRWSGWVDRRDAVAAERRALLDAVLAAPDDLSRRLVFADWLVEHGDPRGEFISLQLSPPSESSSRRQAELIDAYWTEWLRPILDVVRIPPRFEGGFPVAGEVRGPLTRELLAEPTWRTFTSVLLTGVTALQLVNAPQLVSLRTLRGVGTGELAPLLASGAPLTCIAIQALGWGDPNAEANPPTPRDFAAMPTLQRLELDESHARAWRHALPRLKELAVHVRLETAEALISTLEGGAVEVLELCANETVVRLERDEHGEFVKALCLSNAKGLPAFISVLPRSLKSIVSRVEPARVTQHTVEQYQQSLARFPALEPGALPLVARPPRRFFRIELPSYVFERGGLIRMLAQRFDLQLDHWECPEWDVRREFWTSVGERGEPTLITGGDYRSEDRRFVAVLPLVDTQIINDTLKALVRDNYASEVTLSLEGRELRLVSGQWPTLETLHAFLEP